MKIFISMFILLFSIPCYSMTMGEIRSQIRLMINDNNSSSYRYGDQVLLDRMNMVQDEICAKTFALQKRYYINTSSTIAEYRLPTDCIQILRAAYYISGSTTAYKRLAYTTIGGQDAASPYWENLADGEPREYYRRADYIGLKPAPSNSYYGSNYIQLDYIVRAGTMTATTDTPFNDDYTLYPFHQSIIYGVMAMCEFDKGNASTYGTLKIIYEDWLNKIREIINNIPEKGYLNFTK